MSHDIFAIDLEDIHGDPARTIFNEGDADYADVTNDREPVYGLEAA